VVQIEQRQRDDTQESRKGLSLIDLVARRPKRFIQIHAMKALVVVVLLQVLPDDPEHHAPALLFEATEILGKSRRYDRDAQADGEDRQNNPSIERPLSGSGCLCNGLTHATLPWTKAFPAAPP